ncbi:MAG: hypothetical protein QOG04_2341 [Actinomycetota bacterium]|nr:hypothetical protein [Actinomycetota bacterium]
MKDSRWVAAGASLVALIVVLWGKHFIGSGVSSPVFLHEAREVLAGGKAGVVFPLGYVAVVAAGLWIADLNGVMILQACVFVAGAVICYRTLVLCGVREWRAIAGASLVVLHPQAVLAIRRVGDIAIVYPMMIMVISILVLLRTRPATWVRVAGLGCLLGVMFVTRPNLITILPALAWILRGVLDLKRWAVVLATAVVVVVGVTTPLAGRPIIASSRYGAYVFFVGANGSTAGALLDGNVELSVGRVADAGKLPFETSRLGRWAPVGLNSDESDQLFAEATRFVREHPIQFAGLAVLKLATLFRPDLGNSTHPLEPIVQLLSALPIVIWLVARFWLRRAEGIFSVGTVLLLAAMYVAPFVLTAAAPRYRYPLDVLFLMDAAVSYWGPNRLVTES